MSINLGWGAPAPAAPALVDEVEALADERRATAARDQAERDAAAQEAYAGLLLALARGRSPRLSPEEVTALIAAAGRTDRHLREDLARVAGLLAQASPDGLAMAQARAVVEARRAVVAWREAIEAQAKVVRAAERAEAAALSARNAAAERLEQLRSSAVDRRLLPEDARAAAHAALVAWEGASRRLALRLQLEALDVSDRDEARRLLGAEAPAVAARPVEDLRAEEERAADAYLAAQGKALARAGEVGLTRWLSEEGR
ncbi:MAG: hypothetical protein M9894_17175 [Planctomycetes bacterium]|nr:hypothetical protein [Planctomycetota bacterium]